MTATITTTARRDTHLVSVDGVTVGRITHLGRSYRAARKAGTATDIRRVSQGFRTVEAAAAWITA